MANLVASSILLLCLLVLFTNGGRPVAHWDMVPYQAFSQPFNLGIVSFHISGVHVTMYINGTKLVTIQDPTYNPQSNVWEFWTTIDPSKYSDGLLNITAECAAIDGVSPTYTPPPLYLYANTHGAYTVSNIVYADSVHGNDSASGTQSSPVKTLSGALNIVPQGGTVYLLPGNYPFSSVSKNEGRNLWTNVQPAPGVASASVMSSGGRQGFPFLHFRNMTFYGNSTTGYIQLLYGAFNFVWLDDCRAISLIQPATTGVDYLANYGTTAFVTGGVTFGLTNGPLYAYLIKDHLLDGIYSDSWSTGLATGKMVLNCDTQYQDPQGTGNHPDFFQGYNGPQHHDTIIYNVRALHFEGQGFFGSNIVDSAFVNILLDERPQFENLLFSQIGNTYDNVLYAHVTTYNHALTIRGTPLNFTDVYFINNVVKYVNYVDSAPPNFEFFMNHTLYYGFFYGTTVKLYGENTIFAPLTNSTNFVNPNETDYRLVPNSAGWRQGMYLQSVPADITGRAHDVSSRNIGAYGTNAGPIIFPIRNTSTNPSAFGPVTFVVPTPMPPSTSSSSTGSPATSSSSSTGSPATSSSPTGSSTPSTSSTPSSAATATTGNSSNASTISLWVSLAFSALLAALVL